MKIQANKVVIFDPSWSTFRIRMSIFARTHPLPRITDPANDLQAMDRAFRMGQKRDVYVS